MRFRGTDREQFRVLSNLLPTSGIPGDYHALTNRRKYTSSIIAGEIPPYPEWRDCDKSAHTFGARSE